MTDTTTEVWVSRFWEQANASGHKIPFFLASNPRLTVQAVDHVCHLPLLEARLSSGPEGRLITRGLNRICIAKLFRIAATGACVLTVPEMPGHYRLGSSKQTLRRKIRAAESAGVTCRFVTAPKEQATIAERLDQAYKTKSDIRYRETNSDHSHLVGTGLWTVAFGADGQPLVIAVTPRDGAWAMLQIFVTLGETQQHSDARYLLTEAVVDRLSAEGVRYLFDTRSPAELPNGLRHFQKMLGFRIARVRVTSQKPMGSAKARRKSAIMLEGRQTSGMMSLINFGTLIAAAIRVRWQIALITLGSCAAVRDSTLSTTADLMMQF